MWLYIVRMPQTCCIVSINKESEVTQNMPLGFKKETFLLNGSNKQRFIKLLVRNYTKAILKLTEFGWWCWFLKTVDKADDNTVVLVEKTLICWFYCAIMQKKADAAFFSLLTNRSQHNFWYTVYLKHSQFLALIVLFNSFIFML